MVGPKRLRRQSRMVEASNLPRGEPIYWMELDALELCLKLEVVIWP